ncbi:hypothetical protein SI65_01372 [Aspergillus cristatus]|uniref:Histone h1.3 n=1 Tax=Aspergillus cristatus TaxID=573508 RepID=A0A1E3BS36_ASPCR|nr:hypothetical protein SI65_01372 [Aspergillus cristatus]
MSGKAKPEALLGLSASEAKLILMASYLSTDQKVDYEKLAQLGGYKTAASASTLYRNAKRKLAEYIPANLQNSGGGATNTNANTPDATPANTPKKTPTKRKTPAKGGEDGNGAVEESPTKQKKQRTPAKEAKMKEAKDESEPGTPSARPMKMEDELFPYVKLDNGAA